VRRALRENEAITRAAAMCRRRLIDEYRSFVDQAPL
jgi:hypothetical protein